MEIGMNGELTPGFQGQNASRRPFLRSEGEVEKVWREFLGR